MVMWEEAGLRVRRLSGHVEVLDPSTDSTPFALAAGPVSTFAAWNNYPDMKAAVVGRSPAFLAQARATPVAVWTGSDFAVAWAALGRVFIARFSAEGERLFELGGGTNSIGVSRVAAIGASGTKVLAVWSDTDLVGRGAVAGSGSTVLTDPIAQREDRAAEFSVAGDGRDFLVTWINQGIASNDFIMGRRVGADGRTIGAANYYSGGGDSKYALRVFWTGTNYLVVWATREDRGVSNLWAARIAANGTLIDSPPHHIGALAGSVRSWAWSGGRLAVAYVRSDGLTPSRAFVRVTAVTPRSRAIRSR